jgi:hypothetical protein
MLENTKDGPEKTSHAQQYEVPLELTPCAIPAQAEPKAWSAPANEDYLDSIEHPKQPWPFSSDEGKAVLLYEMTACQLVRLKFHSNHRILSEYAVHVQASRGVRSISRSLLQDLQDCHVLSEIQPLLRHSVLDRAWAVFDSHCMRIHCLSRAHQTAPVSCYHPLHSSYGMLFTALYVPFYLIRHLENREAARAEVKGRGGSRSPKRSYDEWPRL